MVAAKGDGSAAAAGVTVWRETATGDALGGAALPLHPAAIRARATTKTVNPPLAERVGSERVISVSDARVVQLSRGQWLAVHC